MSAVPLARLWHLPDGTTCLLLKDPLATNWEVRVVRSEETLRSERFGNPIVAMEDAKQWRTAYDPRASAAS